jgi:hypothetical protein
MLPLVIRHSNMARPIAIETCTVELALAAPDDAISNAALPAGRVRGLANGNKIRGFAATLSAVPLTYSAADLRHRQPRRFGWRHADTHSVNETSDRLRCTPCPQMKSIHVE